MVYLKAGPLHWLVDFEGTMINLELGPDSKPR